MLNVQSLISPFVKNFINIIFFRKKFTIFKVSSINSHSMEPNYHEGSYYLAEKMNDSINLDRYKVVIFFCDKHSTNHIKRIIGLPKEKISIRNGSLYINDKIIKDFKIAQNINIDTEISNDSFYLLSDNLKLLGNACDSILIGPIEKNKFVAVIV